jgi:hypothetical protein
MKSLITFAILFLTSSISFANDDFETQELFKQEVKECSSKIVWKTIGVGALYGGGVMAVASTLAVALAPAGVVAAPIATVAGNTIIGSLLGGGGSAVSTGYIIEKTNIDPAHLHCVKEYYLKKKDSITEQKERLDKALKGLGI